MLPWDAGMHFSFGICMKKYTQDAVHTLVQLYSNTYSHIFTADDSNSLVNALEG